MQYKRSIALTDSNEVVGEAGNQTNCSAGLRKRWWRNTAGLLCNKENDHG
jgi:hypothetical protein